ncbi:MAG: endonuclease/exonuclease/phosphatase family protein [Ignavibacteriaceae bacterium]|nr:endonuclease/exonuclease/phosphatase family protein [Ignavibacteriaceae bacterium]
MNRLYTKVFIPAVLFIAAFTVNINSQDTIKIVTYNLLNYPGSDTTVRNPYFRKTMKALNADIICVQEVGLTSGVPGFLNNVLNAAEGGGYSSGTFINGYDSDNAVFYKTSKFTFLSNTPINAGSNSRDLNEFKLIHNATGDTIRLISLHLKAGNTSSDALRRSSEVDSLRNFTNRYPEGTDFLVMGDFNIYGSSEAAYQKMLQITPGVEGELYDIISMTGTWNTPGYAPYHTQSPRTRQFGGGSTGGMDDRFDMILMSKAVKAVGGMEYIASTMKAYGNDGNHFNDSINRPSNTAVGQELADALHYASDHLPVVAMFRMNPPVSADNEAGPVTSFALNQNYPNPFNPGTTISYSVPAEGWLNFRIFNISGEQVSSAFEGEVNQGMYSYYFDASGLSSGVYFAVAEFKSAAGVQVREVLKMTLLK